MLPVKADTHVDDASKVQSPDRLADAYHEHCFT